MPRIPAYADIGIHVDSVSWFSAAADIDVGFDSVSYLSSAAGIDVDIDFVVLHLFLDCPFCGIHYCRNHHRSQRRNRRRNRYLIRRLLQEQADFQETQPIRRFQPLHDFGKTFIFMDNF